MKSVIYNKSFTCYVFKQSLFLYFIQGLGGDLSASNANAAAQTTSLSSGIIQIQYFKKRQMLNSKIFFPSFMQGLGGDLSASSANAAAQTTSITGGKYLVITLI